MACSSAPRSAADAVKEIGVVPKTINPMPSIRESSLRTSQSLSSSNIDPSNSARAAAAKKADKEKEKQPGSKGLT